MDRFNKLKVQVQSFIFVVLALCTTLVVVVGWVARQFYPGHDTSISIAMLLLGLVICLVLSVSLTNYALKPLGLIWRAFLHVTPGHGGTTPPNLQAQTVGRELVTSLAMQIYQLASSAGPSQTVTATKFSLLAQAVVDNLPLPVYVMDKTQTIVFANTQAARFLELESAQIVGRNCYSVLDFMFSDAHKRTFDSWLQNARAHKVTDEAYWNHVRLRLSDQHRQKQCDMATFYSRDSSAGLETIVVLFDQTARYNTEDGALNFIALAVHELRTPLTILRGYIEVFEDELSPQLNPEMTDFMHKMNASAQQLSAFVSNILNVARVEEDQWALKLEETNWTDLLRGAVADLNLRAQVHGKTIRLSVDANVPPVAVDKVSILEVINNLVDNAIKYSGQNQYIDIRSYLTPNQMVETTVQDYGIGIPISIMPHLFKKFERSHRSRVQLGGTGLGLYLCKALITAHGGNIWVKSTEGQGSTFGFTVLPYAQLADELKNNNTQGIVRNAHGWIKNHSLYRN